MAEPAQARAPSRSADPAGEDRRRVTTSRNAGEIDGQHDGLPGSPARNLTKSERLKQSHAERPDVRGSGTVFTPVFRSTGRRVAAHRAFAGATDRVAGQFDWSPTTRMSPPSGSPAPVSAVQERQRVQTRHEHLSRFVFRQGVGQQQLSQRLVGVLHDGVQVGQSLQAGIRPTPACEGGAGEQGRQPSSIAAAVIPPALDRREPA